MSPPSCTAIDSLPVTRIAFSGKALPLGFSFVCKDRQDMPSAELTERAMRIIVNVINNLERGIRQSRCCTYLYNISKLLLFLL